MDELIGKMYSDSMIINNINLLRKEAALTNGERISDAWNKVSEGLKDMIPRIAVLDIAFAKELLAAWKEVGEGETDFRVLAAETDHRILPLVRKAIGMMYPPMNDVCGDWEYISTPTGYFSIKSKINGRYIHSPYDPMEEARILADELYQDGKDGAVLLGAGLGYLAYQLWIKSEKTWKIVIYEDDELLLQSAFYIGVLEWIDKD